MNAEINLNGTVYELEGTSVGTYWGTLVGEDAETGERWSMKFWVPEAAVTLYGTEDAA